MMPMKANCCTRYPGVALLLAALLAPAAWAQSSKETPAKPASNSPAAAPAMTGRTLPLTAPQAPTAPATRERRSNFESKAAAQGERPARLAAPPANPGQTDQRPRTANSVIMKTRVPASGLRSVCQQAITMWDSYGDGWNGGFIDVYVNGNLELGGLTLAGGAGPETVYISAETGDQISTVWTAGDYAVEPSYCIYDAVGGQLGCDGLNDTEPTGITVTASCESTGACCDPFTASCSDNVEFASCQAPLLFTLSTLCADLTTPCGDPGVCCTDTTSACTNGLRANCSGRFISGGACGEFNPTCGAYHACQHTIVIENSDPWGWSGGNTVAHVYVNGVRVLSDLTLHMGETRQVHAFTAGDLDAITTEFVVPPGWVLPTAASYCLYDGAGNPLGCDGEGSAVPSGMSVQGLCAGTGSCCNPFNGSCTDNVDVWDCQPPLHFTNNTLCANLPVPCGNPGACCNQSAGTCTQEFEANCAGRFAPGAACNENPFTPPCGATHTCDVLVVPADSEFEYSSDNDFMEKLSARTFSDTDFMSGQATTPTLAQLQQYDMVITYANGLYKNRKDMGNVLADYVESGGKVILGNYSDYTQGSIDWLDGRLMREYNPGVVEYTDWGADYQEDGADCIFDGVGSWRTLPWDILSGTQGSAVLDGTYVNDSTVGPPSGPVAAYRLDRSVYYLAGYMAGYLATAAEEEELAQLTANICYCETDANLTGACCNPFAGTCTDNVSVAQCMPPMQWTVGTLCANLPEPCGNLGACCNDANGGCTEEFERNCTGRFVAGETCATAVYDPPCGQDGQYDILYAPTSGDSPQFRQEVAFILNSRCDYHDASESMPTLAQLQQYEAVITWTNYPYAGEPGEFGDLLAHYVEGGGKVILGLWSVPGAGQFNWLEGRLMDEYNPSIVEDTRRGGGDYTGGGVDCIHNDIEMYGAPLVDEITSVTPLAWWDGQIADDYGNSTIAVSYLLDRSVYHVSGFSGGFDGPGDWAKLITNIMRCPASDVRGACCTFEDGGCIDDVRKQDCLPPRHWTHDTDCADLNPKCGWPGACCDDTTGTCSETVFMQCHGRHVLGETCATATFDPPCGEYESCTHTFTAWSDYSFGWVEAFVDVYVGGLLRVANITLASGTGPASLQFQAADGEDITTVWHPGKFDGGYDFVASYCINAPDGTTLACDGLDGARPTGISTEGSCLALECGNGVCQYEGGESCADCPEDCGACRCINQALKPGAAYLSDLDCQVCGEYPLQLLADNFNVYETTHVSEVTFWGAYAPGENIPATDAFTLRILENAGGPPGAEVAAFGPLAGTRTGLGEGAYRYVVQIDATLPAGGYYLEIYSNSVGSDETWAWSPGFSDIPFGKTGAAYSTDHPEVWFPAGGLDLAFTLTCAAVTVPGDVDGDGDVDLDDYADLADCMSGPGVAHASGCGPSNMDGDTDVDLLDFAMWSRFMTAPPH
jgi:hypothetical protein